MQEEQSSTVWEGHTDLLAWILYTGGAHAAAGPVRSGYIELIRYVHGYELEQWSRSWDELREVLAQFIWSSKAFDSQVGTFWNDVHKTEDDGILHPSVEGPDSV